MYKISERFASCEGSLSCSFQEIPRGGRCLSHHRRFPQGEIYSTQCIRVSISLEESNMVVEFFQLLVPLVSSYRYSGDDVNLHLAKTEAKILHEKIAAKEYSCDDIIRILTTRSKAQINATLNQYKNEFGNDINKVCFFLRQP